MGGGGLYCLNRLQRVVLMNGDVWSNMYMTVNQYVIWTFLFSGKYFYNFLSVPFYATSRSVANYFSSFMHWISVQFSSSRICVLQYVIYWNWGMEIEIWLNARYFWCCTPAAAPPYVPQPLCYAHWTIEQRKFPTWFYRKSPGKAPALLANIFVDTNIALDGIIESDSAPFCFVSIGCRNSVQ
jgi:hypothetical protein